MNKRDARHQLIRSLVLEKNIHTQHELQEALKKNGVSVTQATLSRDIKALNLVKVSSENSAHYVIHNISKTRWEDRLKFYMEDALVMMKPVQHQVVIKTLPGLAQSFGSILDALTINGMVATICGDDTCLIVCQDNQSATYCFEQLKEFTPPFFFSEQ